MPSKKAKPAKPGAVSRMTAGRRQGHEAPPPAPPPAPLPGYAPARRRGAPAHSAGSIVDAAPNAPAVVKSAGRVLEILEFFDELQREARVGEIAERLDYPQSSTSVLLKSLVQLGYLDYDAESRTYLPSPRVTLLGAWLGAGPVRDGGLIRMMEELNHVTGECVFVATRNGIYSQYIRVLQATSKMRLHVPIGSRRLLAWSASGFTLLQDQEPDMVRSLVRRTNAEAQPEQKRIDPRQTLAHIETVRRQGYFFSRGLVTPGAGAIAMPLPTGIDRRDRALTICVSGWTDHLERNEDNIVAIMRDAVARYIEPALDEDMSAARKSPDNKRRKG